MNLDKIYVFHIHRVCLFCIYDPRKVFHFAFFHKWFSKFAKSENVEVYENMVLSIGNERKGRGEQRKGLLKMRIVVL